MKVDKVSPQQLEHIIRATDHESLLLVDCRSLLAFNDGCIKGAVNFFCPAILKRRLVSKGSMSLDMVLSMDVRKKLRSGGYTRLVLYDGADREDHVDEEGNTNEITSITNALKFNRFSLKNIHLLKGGFKRFKSECPHLCSGIEAKHESLSSSITSPQTLLPANQRPVSEDEPTQLLPHLYIGDHQHSTNRELLKRLGVTAILNVSTTCYNHVASDFLYKVIPIRDNGTENISSWFNEALQFIDTVKKDRGKILVHCKAGISRSATICIAYLMHHKSQTLEQAFEFVRAKRSIIFPNLNFMQQLIEFERVQLLKMRDMIYPAISAVSPLSCGSLNDKSTGIASGYFNFNVCAITQT